MPRFAFLPLMLATIGYSQQLSFVEQSPQLGFARPAVDGSGPALAFGRYLASIQERSRFIQSGPIEVEIEASLPGLAKQGSMLLVREAGAFDGGEIRVVEFDGDSTVRQQVIARYLNAEEQAEALPYSEVAISPANYKFRYIGSVETNGTKVYIFQIAPRKKRTGLIQGQIWIDSITGIALHQAGRFVKQPSVFIRRLEIARDTTLRDGRPHTRVTHVAIGTRLVGRAELAITERPLETTTSLRHER